MIVAIWIIASCEALNVIYVLMRDRVRKELEQNLETTYRNNVSLSLSLSAFQKSESRLISANDRLQQEIDKIRKEK